MVAFMRRDAMQLYAGRSDHHAWYSVETSQAFHEIKLPVEERLMTAEQRRAYHALLELSEQYGTGIRQSPHRNR
jgi:hypothetical protein